MNTITKNAVLVACASAAFVGAYTFFSTKSTPLAPPPAPPGSQTATATDAYPPARFFRDPEALSRVVVDVRHILIAHSGSASIPMLLHMPIKRVTRSREEAQTLARRLSSELQADQSSFDAYARRYSDDEATAPFDGAFGPSRVTMLPRELASALAVLPTDEVSRPIETAAGFHVIVRRPLAPRPTTFAAKQILVLYDQPGADAHARVGRTREEARALAGELRDRALRAPESFGAISQELNPTLNVDWGAFTTFAPDANALGLYALSRIRVGEITPIIDTRSGFLILERTSDVERERLAAAFIGIDTDRARDAGAPARDRALRALADKPSVELASFASEQTRLCASSFCEEPIVAWRRGALSFGALEQALLDTPVGGTSAIVESAVGTFVLYRVDPTDLPALSDEAPPEYVTELPDNSVWSFEEHITRLPTQRLVMLVRQFQTQVVGSLAVPEEQRVRTLEAVERLAQGFERSPKEERAALFASCEHDVREILGATGYAKLQSARETWFISMSRL